MERVITEEMLKQYQEHLQDEEKSSATMEKYGRDLHKLKDFADGREITKKLMVQYKEKLTEDRYKISSINSCLVAANRFLEYMGWYDARVKTYKIQREAFCPDKKNLTREEYKRLAYQAKKLGKQRLYMLMQTIAATGMRVSEIQYLTVSAVKHGMLVVSCKGKTRSVLLPSRLQKGLLLYIKQENILSGTVFCTKSGRPVDRSNIWRDMKTLCKEAGVEEEKVFPHNLRHLFAQCFYEIKKDIAKLADVLGHSSIETTKIYIRTSSREHRKQLEMMDLVCIV